MGKTLGLEGEPIPLWWTADMINTSLGRTFQKKRPRMPPNTATLLVRRQLNCLGCSAEVGSSRMGLQPQNLNLEALSFQVVLTLTACASRSYLGSHGHPLRSLVPFRRAALRT